MAFKYGASKVCDRQVFVKVGVFLKNRRVEMDAKTFSAS